LTHERATDGDSYISDFIPS